MAVRWCLLLALAAGATAGPLSNRVNDLSTTCSTTCPETTKFSYETGKTYEYTYESDINTSITGASEEHSSLHVRANVQVEVLAPCEMALKLTDVSLQDSNPLEYESREHVEGMWDFKQALQEKPLRFAFLDGRVDDICGETEEDWVLNVKKGVLSGFQNTMESLDTGLTTKETDVAGECPVTYEVERGGWGVTKVKKTKDLLGCTERLGHLTAFQSSPYKAPSAIQSLPLLKSTHECEQEINSNGVLSLSICRERHIFRPFSRHDNGAATSVSSKMTFVKMTPGVSTSQGAIRNRDSLTFTHILSPKAMEATARQAKQTLNQMCRATQQEITPEIPKLFTQLVRQMHNLDSAAMSTLFTESKELCEKAEKFVRDAIPMTASAGSVNLIRKLIVDGDVSDLEADLWLTHLSFIANPTKEMLIAIKPLLDLPQPFRKASLAISTMVHSYCRKNAGCDREPEVRQIISLFEDKLHYNCKAESPESHDVILMALKSLGNTGYAHSAIPAINRCFQNAEVSNEIRAAAINAFRRMGCEVDYSELTALFSNMQEDSELRINAYLALMQCPSTATIETVLNMLHREEVNQVGSFVWTHLTNLRESSDPHKKAVQDILADRDLQKTFNLDKRKYSRNVEVSYFSELLNAGAQVDANLIWSQHSFIPRSAMVNLTLDVFGESVNMLEIGGRVQGLERMLESLLREEDNDKTTSELMNSIDSRYNMKADDPQGSYYIRVFGNEIRYDDLHTLDLDNLKERMNYLDWLIELSKEHNVEFTKSFMFLDLTMSVPTVAGMPLCLTMDGTSVVNVGVTGKLDIRQMFTSPSTFDIDGTIKPSAAVEINQEMGVDAFVARTGIKMVTSIHTSTQATGKIQLKNGKVFNMEISAPQGQKEIVKAESKFFVTYRSQDREQRMLTEGRQEKTWCSGQPMATVTGMKVCAHTSLPPLKTASSPWLPFTGPSSASITIENVDTFRTFNVDYRLTRERTRTEGGPVSITDTGLLSINTPGSSVDRELTAELIRTDNSALTFNLRTPWKKVTLEATNTNTAELKKVTGTFSLDERNLFNLDAEVGVNQKAVRTEFTPKVELSFAGKRPYIIQGDVGYRAGKKAEVDLRVRNVLREPVRVQGSIDATVSDGRRKYDTELQLTSGLLSGRFTGSTETVRRQSLAVTSSLEYTFKNMEPQRFTFSETIRNTLEGQLRSYSIDSAWTSSMWPAYDGNVVADLNVDRTTVNGNLNAGFDENRKIISNLAATYHFDRTSKNIDGTLGFKFPLKNMDHSAHLGYLHNENQLQTTASLRMAPGKEGSFGMNLHRQSVEPMKVSADLSLTYPGFSFSISDKLEEMANKELHQDLLIKLQPYEDVRISSVYKRLPRHEVDASIYLPGYQPLNIKAHLNPDMKHAQARGEVNYGGRQYFTETSWIHRGNARTFNTRGDMTISWPERRITVDGSASRQGDIVTTTMETKWDAGVNEDKKVSLNGQVTLTPTEPAVQMKVMVFPHHFVDIDVNGKYETQGWYKSNSDVEGRLHLRTSFQNWEEISASFKHDRTKTEYLTEGELTWAPRQKVSGNFDIKKIRNWNKIESSLRLSTPFDGFRDVQTDLSYNLAATKFSTASKMQLDGQVIDLEVNTELNKARHLFNGDVTFKSPFRYYENLQAAATYNDDGTSYRSSAEASWAPEKKITGMFTMAHQQDRNSMSNTGELTISTPFEEFSALKATWHHQGDASSLQSSANAEVNQESIGGYEVEARTTKTAQLLTLDVRAVLQNPKADDITFILDHQHNYKSYRNMKSDVSLRWTDDKAITLQHEMRRGGDAVLVVKSTLNTPFRGYEKLSIDSDTKNMEGHIVSAHELEYGSQQKINLNADMTITGYSGQGRIQFTSPYSDRVVVNFRNQKDDGIWVSHYDTQYQNGKRLELDTQFGCGPRKVLSAHIQSECPYLKNALFSTTFTGTRRNFESTLEVMHEKLAERIRSNIMVNTADVNDIKVSGELLTPFEKVRFAKAEVNHRVEGNSIHSDAAVEIPSYKGTVSNDVTSRNGRFLSTETVVEYIAGKKIELSTEFKNARKRIGSVSLKTPWTNDILVSINHEGSLTSFSNEAEVRYSPSDVISSNVNFNLRGAALTLDGRIQTPFEPARRIVITANHDGTKESFRNDGSVQVNDLTINGNTEFSLSGYTMHAKADLRSTTPLNGFTTISGEVNHNGPATNFNNDATFKLGSRQVTGSSEFSLRGNSLTGKATIQLPLTVVRDIAVEVTHNGPINAFSNKAQITYDNQEIIGTSEFNLRGNSLSAKANIQTPFRGAENMAIELGHNGPANDFTCNALLQLNRKKVTGTTRFHLSGNEMTGNIDIKLPVRALRNLGLEIRHSGPANAFNNAATLTYGDNQITASSEFALGENSLNAKATVNTPYENYRTVAAEVNHNGPKNAFTNNAVITYGSKEIRGGSEFSLRGSTLRAKIDIATPCESLRTASAEIHHEGHISNFKNNIVVSIGNDEIRGNTEFALDGTSLMTKAALSMPYFDALVMSAEFTHSGAWNDFNNHGVIIYGPTQISGNSRFSLRSNTMNGLIALELPGEISRVSIEVNHDGPLYKFGNNAVITIGEKTINAESSFEKVDSGFNAGISLRTPYQLIRRASVNLEHSGHIQDFQNSIQGRFNGKTASANSEFHMQGTTVELKGGMSLPIEGYETLSFEATHNGPKDNFRNSIVFSCGSHQARQECEFSLDGNNVHGKYSLELPLETPFTASLEVNHQGPANDFSNSFVAVHGGTEIRGSSNFHLQGNTMDLGANINGLPVKGLRKLGIELHHSGHTKQFTNNGAITYGKNQISANTEFTLNANALRGKVEVTTPYNGYKTMSAEINHEGMSYETPYATTVVLVCGNKEINLQGQVNLQNPVSIQVNLHTPYDALNQVELSLNHDGKNWRNFNNNGMLKWNNEKYTGKSEFRWYGKMFRLKAELNVPEEYSIKLNHKGGLTDFSNNVKFQLADDSITGTSSFKLAGKTLEGNANIESTFRNARNMEITIGHDGGYEDFRSTISVVTPLRKYKNWAATVTYKGQPSDFELGLNVNTPLSKFSAVEGKITHAGSLKNFRCSYNINVDGTAYNGAASFKKTARKLEANIDAETPFSNFERLAVSITHTKTPNSCETAINVDTSYPGYERFVGEFSLQGVPTDFRSSSKLETPFTSLPSLTVIYNHKGDFNKFNCDGSVEYAGETSTGTIAYEKMTNGVQAAINIRTPYRGYNKFEASLEHTASGSDFHTVISIETPFAGFHKFASEFTHSGGPYNFRTTARIETPFEALPSLTANVNHEYTANQMSSGVSAEYSGKRLTASVNHATNDRRLESGLRVETPYPGYENFAIGVTHGGERNNFKTTADVTTSVRGYRSFGWSVEHNGDLSNFQTTATVTTPFAGYERFGLNVNHNCNARTFKTGASITTSIPGYENFGVEIEKSGTAKDFTAAITVTTPFPHYESMKVELAHECSARKFMNNIAITTSCPHYEQMGLKMTFEGTMEAFNTELVATSSVPGYEKFALNFDKSGSLSDLTTTVRIETPIRKYRKIDVTLTHNGHLGDFTTNVQADTSIPKYKRLSGQLRHSGRLNNFESNALVESSYPGYEKFAVNVNHEGSLHNFRTTGRVETPFRGHETYNYNVNHNYGRNIRSNVEVNGPTQQYGASLNHQVDGANFDSNLRFTTPFQGYERFGYVMSHQREKNLFRNTGTIELPCPVVPEIKYTVAFNGHLYDFTSSATVEYNAKKIEATGTFKRTSSYAETIYEGSVGINTPYESLRDFHMTGTHNRRTDLKSGTLDVEHNGEKKVDFDYSYTTNNPVTISINIRNPHPLETRINVNTENGAVTGDAYLNWDVSRPDSNVRGTFNVNLAPDTHTVALTATLPTRTVGLSSTYAKTDSSLSHAANIQWDSDEASQVGYELEVTKTMRRSQCLIDGSLKVSSPLGKAETSYSCKYVPSRRCTVEVSVDYGKRLTLTSDLTMNSPSFTHVLTISHPELKRDAVITTEGTWDPENAVYDGRMEAQVNRETASFAGRVAREDAGKYMASARLEHPNSDLDFQFSGQVEDTPETVLGSMETKWLMSADRQFRVQSLRAEINKLRKQLEMNVVTPLVEVHVAGRQLSAQDGIYRYSGEATFGQSVYRGETELNIPAKQADLKVFYSQDNFLHAYAKYLSRREIKAEVYRQHNGQRIQELLWQTAQQDDSHSITGRSYMRPDMYEDIKSAIASEDYGSDWATFKRALVATATEEYNLKKQALSRSFRPVIRAYNDMAEACRQIRVEWRRWLQANWNRIKAEYRQMYEDNKYHMKDIWEWVQRMTAKTQENYTVVKTQLYDASAAAASGADDLWSRIKQAARNLHRQTRTQLSDLSDRYENFDIQPHIDNARSTIDEYTERVRNHESVQGALEYIGRLREQWESYQSEQQGASAVVASDSSSWVGYAKEVMEQLSKREDIKAARDYIHGKIQNSQWANDYAHYRRTVRSAIDDYSEGGVEAVKRSALDWVKENLQWDRNTFTKWLPEAGEYEYELYVPLPLEDLQTMPKVTIRLGDYIRSLYNLYSDCMPEYGWSFSDLYYRYRPSGDFKDWVPPFDTYAAISGNQHYMTFDKRFYEFAGECSYLLARDFIDGAFAVVVNYERAEGGRATRKSITAFLDDQQIEIFPDGKIIMNNARMEMPVSMGHTQITRSGNLLKLGSTHGVDITCDLAHDFCTVEVSGWYFAKTAGLFGTYNNEPVDDMTTIDHRQATTAADFAASWATTSRCRPVNSAVDVSREVGPGNRRYELCARFFQQDTSPYRRCFSVIAPEPYMTMCLNDFPVDSNRMERAEDTCNVASYYKEHCARKGVPIRLENDCVRCQKPDGVEFVQGQNVTISGDEVPEAADVVFVIQQAECNQEITAQLKDLVDDMEKVFKAEGMVRTRYALVGYGGQGLHADPHAHTMEGQIFNSRDKILLGLENFDTNGGIREDAFAAIKYAAKLPFATGVSKSVVLLRCSACNQGPVSFSEIQQLLLLRDIRLHVLLQHNFELRGSSPKTAYIFGADRDTAYTRKDAGTNNLEGDPSLRQIMRMPKDLCVALTEETDGSVFNTLQWINNRPFVQKRYRDVLVRVIADKAEPTDCQICECMPDNVGAGTSVCRSCESPDPIYDFLPEFKDFEPQGPAQIPDSSQETVTPPPRSQQQITETDPRKRAKQLKKLKAKKQREARRLRMLNRQRQRS